ncbi:leucine-rich repeat-containing protein 3B-like [Ostrea edulis]|uniref:leucine-rich repeat-containing protein 3B-like n=1 Tax=Ostrea edulis TaxID=37623 RepID=UPI0024AEE8B7|nr:leucine-rich repeat-containing protein 3B-like [Ostrea edulis]
MLMIPVLVFFGSVISVTSDRACDVCRCRDTKVDCMSQSLKEIPTDIPKNTTELYLQYNQITKIPEAAFSDLVKLRILNLQWNQITMIPETAFSGLVNLQDL